MGIFDFWKDAGDDLNEAEMAKPPAGNKETLSPEQARMRLDQKRSVAISQRLIQSGLDASNVMVYASGETLTLSGKVGSQEAREKVVLAAGNIAGVGKVIDHDLVVETPEPEATFYTVQSGDSLSKIAKEQYGDAMKYPMIFEANKPMLSDPDKIYPGQVLRIPPLAD